MLFKANSFTWKLLNYLLSKMGLFTLHIMHNYCVLSSMRCSKSYLEFKSQYSRVFWLLLYIRKTFKTRCVFRNRDGYSGIGMGEFGFFQSVWSSFVNDLVFSSFIKHLNSFVNWIHRIIVHFPYISFVFKLNFRSVKALLRSVKG